MAQVRASIFKDLKELAGIPIIIIDIVEKITAGADVLDLEVDEEALQRAVGVGSIDSGVETLKSLISVVKASASDIQHSMVSITNFVENAPAEVEKAA